MLPSETIALVEIGVTKLCQNGAKLRNSENENAS